jgi:hypothetical protein
MQIKGELTELSMYGAVISTGETGSIYIKGLAQEEIKELGELMFSSVVITIGRVENEDNENIL